MAAPKKVNRPPGTKTPPPSSTSPKPPRPLIKPPPPGTVTRKELPAYLRARAKEALPKVRAAQQKRATTRKAKAK